MCLRYITDNNPKQGVFVGYKLFSGKLGLFKYRGLYVNKYYKKHVVYLANPYYILSILEGNDKYVSGFHIFKTVEDLELYVKSHYFPTLAIVTKVLYSWPLCEGVESTYDYCIGSKVVVAGKMKIVEELGHVISTNAGFETDEPISRLVYYSANKVGKPIQIPATL